MAERQKGKKHIWIFIFINILLFLTAVNSYQQSTYHRAIHLEDLAVSQEISESVEVQNNSEGKTEAYQLSVPFHGLLFTGPYYTMEEGKYTLSVSYQASEDARIEIYSNSWLNEDNSTGKIFAEIILPKENTEIKGDFVIERNVRDLETKVYCENGTMTLGGMQLTSSRRYSDAFLLFFFVAAMEAAFLLLWRRDRKKEFVYDSAAFLFTACLALGATLPFLNDFGYYQHDNPFHFDRILGIADWLKHWSLLQPVQRINAYSFEGAGYVSPVYYPQVFLLLPAIFMRLGGSLLFSYKLFVYLVNFAAAGIAYYSFAKLSGRKMVGAVGAALYTFSLYRLIDIYTRGAVGEYLAMAFMPLFFWSLYEVIFRNDKRWGSLALAATCILQSHILSTVMCAELALVFVVCGVGKLMREPRRIRALLCAAALTCLINAWFLIPFVQSSLLPVNAVAEKSNLAESALYPSQMFAVFVDSTGDSIALGTTQGEMPLSVGFSLMVGVCLYLIAGMGKRRESGCAGNLFLLSGCLTLWMSSVLFPWNLAEHLPQIVNVQYVWRYMALASGFLSYVGALGIHWLMEQKMRERGRAERRGLLCVTAAAICFCTLPYMDSILERQARTGEDRVEWAQADNLYLYQNISYKTEDKVNQLGDAPMQIENLHKEGSSLTMTASIQGNGEGEWLELPFYYFKGYRVKDESGKTYPITMGETGNVRFLAPKGKHQFSFFFREPALWYAADLISLLAAVGITVRHVRQRCGKTRGADRKKKAEVEV